MRPVRCRRLHPKRLHQSAMPLLAATGAEVAYQPGAPSRYRAPLSTSESGFARPAGVRRLDDVVGVGVLLDDRVAVVALDDVLDPGEVVTRHDREPPRVASNALVLGPAEPDELVASEATHSQTNVITCSGPSARIVSLTLRYVASFSAIRGL